MAEPEVQLWVSLRDVLVGLVIITIVVTSVLWIRKKR